MLSTLALLTQAQAAEESFVATYRVVELKRLPNMASPYARVLTSNVAYVLEDGRARVSSFAATGDTVAKLLYIISNQGAPAVGEALTRSVVVSLQPNDMGSCLPVVHVYGSDSYSARVYECGGLIVRGEILYGGTLRYTFNLVMIKYVPATAIEGIDPFPNPALRLGLIVAAVLITIEAYRGVRSFDLNEILGGDLIRYVYRREEEAPI